MVAELSDEGGFATREFARSLGTRLRAIRSQQHLSLHGVERKSGGRWKAVVVGSYERGDRAVSVQRLAELAEFYGVPMTELLPAEAPAIMGAPTGAPLAKVVLNVGRVHAMSSTDSEPLVRFVTNIQRQRGDYGMSVIAIRQNDLQTLAMIYDMTIDALTEQLVRWQVLAPDSVILDGEP